MLFEVTADDIFHLSDADLRQLIGRLSEQEVRQQGYSPVAVTWGGHQNAPDGGIDVRISLSSESSIFGYVPAAATGFQVKAQDMPRQAILNEMAPNGVLRESIAELAAARGAYIIVSSHGSVADTALTERKNAMREALSGHAHGAALSVEFYDRNRVATWANQHPGLIPWVREKIGRAMSGWRPFADWSSSPAPLETRYLLDEGVRLVGPSEQGHDRLSADNGANALRRILEKPGGIARLVGLSGVGKTRLVQALFDPRIGTDPLRQAEAVYTDIAESPNPQPLELTSRLLQLRQRAILIVDNCNPDLHRRLAARITESDGLLSLITVEYDISDDEPENTNVFKLDVTSVDLMVKILESRFPALAAPSRRVVAEFSGGNPRIAFALASTTKDGDSLAYLRNRDLFERLFHQSKGRDNNLLCAAKACALLYSFDGESINSESELAILGSLVGLGVDEMFSHIAELQRRQLVQRRGKWRAILPHAIANRLATLALEDIPFQKTETAIMNSGSERMIRSFSKRMGYLHDDERAKTLAQRWFSDGGFLERIGDYNELGQACFTNIAPIDPEETLSFIERAAMRMPWFYGEKNKNRTEIVRVLRSIAYEPRFFFRAMDVIKSFALNEVNRAHDFAESVFKSMFSLYLSGTHANAHQRAKIIFSLLSSKNQTENLIGLESLSQMLFCGPFSSHYSFEFGVRSRNYGSAPRTDRDLMEWFGQALSVAEQIGMDSTTLADEVRKVVAKRFAKISTINGMIGALVSLADNYSQKSPWLGGWIAVRTTIKRHKEKMSAANLQALEALAARLQPIDLEGKVRAYALSEPWSALDIAESEAENKDDMLSAQERVVYLCVDLGRLLSHHPEKLDALLPEIFSVASVKISALGRGIADTCDSLRESWTYLLTRYLAMPEKNRHASLLGGFLEEARRRTPKECELILDEALGNSSLSAQFVYFQACAGLTSEGVERLLAALDLDTIPTISFQILENGRLHEGLSDAQLAVFIRKLRSRNDGLPVATAILGMRIFSAKSEKRPISDIVKKMGRELIQETTFQSRDTHLEYMMASIIDVSLNDSDHYALASSVCIRIAEGFDTYKITSWDVSEILKALSKSCPRAVLNTLVENENSKGVQKIFGEIRESRPDPLDDISVNTLIDWAQEKPTTRFTSLAKVIRFSDTNDESPSRNWSPAAQKIIEVAPRPVEILEIFRVRFEPMSLSGSRAHIMATRIPLIQSLINHERLEVSQWSRNTLEHFQQLVENVQALEAKHDKEEDERFE